MMSVKKMIQLYIDYDIGENTWKMLYNMMCHGLISRDNWTKFYDTCKGWYLSDDRKAVYDSDDNDKLIFVYEELSHLRK